MYSGDDFREARIGGTCQTGYGHLNRYRLPYHHPSRTIPLAAFLLAQGPLDLWRARRLAELSKRRLTPPWPIREFFFRRYFSALFEWLFCTLAAEHATITAIPASACGRTPCSRGGRMGYPYLLLPPQPLPQPPQPPQGTAPLPDPWSAVGADPWAVGAAAAATAAAAAAGTGMSPFPGPGAGPAIQPPTYPAPGTANLGAQSGPTVGASTAASPDSLPPSVTPQLAAQPTFQGRGGLDASQSVTGITAEFLFCLLYTSPSPRDRG